MHTQPTRQDAGLSAHSHHVNGQDVDCDQLTHCPAICSCPVDGCTVAVRVQAICHAWSCGKPFALDAPQHHWSAYGHMPQLARSQGGEA